MNGSMRFYEYRPGPRLSEVVEKLWSLSDSPSHAREQIVPSGTVELVINLHDDEFRIYDPSVAGDGCRRFRGAIVSGCYSGPFGIDTREHAAVIGVHFHPGGAGLLGVPASQIADAHVDLEDLWGRGATELRERLCASRDRRQRFRILEEVLSARLERVGDGRRAVKAAVGKLDQRRIEVGEVGRQLGLSRRRFIEIFTEEVGMTPKRYARVRRFQRALSRAMDRRTPHWAELALECGYFDQAHLCRDWIEFTGLSPTAFVALRGIQVKQNHVALPEVGVKSVQYNSAVRT